MYQQTMSVVAVTTLAIGVAAVGCSSEPEPQDPSAYNTYPQSTYPASTQAYPAPTYTQAYPTATTTATAAQPSTGIAIPCTADLGCGTHVCNQTTMTCSFPCAGPQDCQAGFACMTGVCLPGGATQ